jgi:hypothetical protein
MTLVSDSTFRLFLSLVTGGFAALWAIHDIVFMIRLRRAESHFVDKRFGYAMGVVIGMIGIIGTLRFNGVL